jgi:hypothetical protein
VYDRDLPRRGHAIVAFVSEEDGHRLPRGYWGPDRARPILDKTLITPYDVALDGLAPGERAAVDELLAAGRAIGDLNEETEHHQALRARGRLQALHERLGRPRQTADLLELYELFRGPIATTLENERAPFLPVDPFAEGRNVYPWGIEAGEIEAFLQTRPDRREEILGLHTAVRRTAAPSLRRDLATLRRHAVLDQLHPGLRDRLAALLDHPAEPFYAVPYSVAWPDRILAISERLWRAAEAVAVDDADLAAFLRQRSRDLMTDDNEAGDAAWVRGTFGRLDVVVGAYEPYDDDLFGAKGFFGLALLLRDEAGTAELQERFQHLQAIEDALPIDRHRTVQSDIPVGTYDVVVAFGQGIEVNAEILPNDATLRRKYGRRILLRRNFVMQLDVVARLERRWRAAMAPVHHDELTAVGLFRQTTWHEVGHYLGPDTQRSGQTFEDALAEDAAIVEELKSELLSTFACLWLERAGAYSRDDVRAVAAAGILAGLRPVRPLRSQPYPTLWVMQLNHALESGYVRIEDDGVHIEHDLLADTVTSMLRETLAIQDAGTHADSSAFIERYSTWDERHDRIAAAVRSAEQHRFVLPRFAVLDAAPSRSR